MAKKEKVFVEVNAGVENEAKERVVDFVDILNKFSENGVSSCVIQGVENPEVENLSFYKVVNKGPYAGGGDLLLVLSDDSKIEDQNSCNFDELPSCDTVKLTLDELMEIENHTNVLFVINNSSVLIKNFHEFFGVSLISESKVSLKSVDNLFIHKSEILSNQPFSDFDSASVYESIITNTLIRVTNNVVIHNVDIKDSNLILVTDSGNSAKSRSQTNISNLTLSNSELNTNVSVLGSETYTEMVKYNIFDEDKNGIPEDHQISLEDIISPTTYNLGVFSLNIYTVKDVFGRVSGSYFIIKNIRSGYSFSYYILLTDGEKCSKIFIKKLRSFLDDGEFNHGEELCCELIRVLQYRIRTLRNYAGFMLLNKRDM